MPYKPLSSSLNSLFMDSGLLQLHVVAGSTPLYIASATISTELRLLSVFVSQQPASSISWTSDSSLKFTLPPGAGPNHKVRVQASGQSSGMLERVSYPLPQISPAKVSDPATTGMAWIEIVGRYFSHRSATLSVRLGATSCSSSKWISDVSVICRNAAGGGSHNDIIASVELLHSGTDSVVNSSSSAPLSFAFTNNMLASATPWIADDTALFTGGMHILVLGANMGVLDVSVGMRIGASSSRATLWLSDTSTSNRVGQRSNGMNVPFQLSANSLQGIAKLAPDPVSLSFQILSVAPKNIPRTGSSMLTLLGAHFALHSATMALRTGTSASQLSMWVADSNLLCKTTSSRFEIQPEIVLSIVLSSQLLEFEYAASVSTSPLQASFTPVSFPSEQVQDLSNAFLISIFGQEFGKANSIELVQLDGKICSPSLWVSDSSLLCSMPNLLFESNRVKVGFKSDKAFEVPELVMHLF
jgi:hypothetical protein